MKEMYKLFFYFVIIGGLMCGLCDRAFAEEDLTFTLEQVVVTATKTPQKIKNVPATVEVITAEDMKKRNIKMISDVLRLLPGTYVRSDKGLIGDNGTETLRIRGFSGAKYVALLLDGQAMNNAFDGKFNFSNIPIDNIERIEIMRSASSVLYGSNAMAGVINIITKEKPEQATTLHVMAGGMQTRGGSIASNGSAGNLDYFLDAGKTEMDGYVTTTAADGKNGMDRESYHTKFIYHFNEDNKLTLSAGKDAHSYFYEKKKDYGDKDEDNLSFIYEKNFDEYDSIKVSWGQKRERRDILFYSKLEDTLGTARQGEIQYNHQMGKKDLLTVGYSLRTEKVDVNITNKQIFDNAGGKTANHAFYLQDQHTVDEKNIIYLGLRYDYWQVKDGYQNKTNNTIYESKEVQDFTATNLSPKISWVYHANPKLSVRSSIGKSFRAPNMNEMFAETETASALYLPNSALKPERSTNYELGMDYQFNKDFIGRLTIFYNDLDNLIQRNKIGMTKGKKDIIQQQNIGKTETKGFEVGFDKRWNKQWSSFLNYSYVSAKIKENANEPSLIGQQIELVPKNSFNFGLNYQQEKWLGSLTGNYISDPNDDKGKSGYGSYDSYLILDFKVSYQIDENKSLSLSVDNLLDKEYYSYYRSPERTTYLEFSTKF